MKVRTKIKIKEFRREVNKKKEKFLKFILKPITSIYLKREKKKKEKKYNYKYYKISKVRRLLYKEIQNIIVDANEFYIIDNVSDRRRDIDCYGDCYINVSNLLSFSTKEYLLRYSLAIKDNHDIQNFWFNEILKFDNNDIKVELIDKEEAFKSIEEKEFYVPRNVKEQCNKVIKISIVE